MFALVQVVKTRLQQRRINDVTVPETPVKDSSSIGLNQKPVEQKWTSGMLIHGTRAQYNGVIDCVRKTWRNEGIYGFYKGCIPNTIRVAPAAAITFFTYELVADALHSRVSK